MLKCNNGHEQPENSRFCGICGSAITLEDEFGASEVAEWAEVPPEHIDLDLVDDSTENSDTPIPTDDIADIESDDNGGVDANTLEQEGDSDGDEMLLGDGLESDVSEFDYTHSSQSFAFGTSVSSDTMQRLQLWASEYDETEHPFIKGLQEAVANRDDLSMWASLDPQKMLPHPDPIDGRRWDIAARLFGFLRNVLVFVPVLLTWLSIGEAVGAFGEYARIYEKEFGEDTTIQFLQFWQDPERYSPGLLGHFWTIGSVAFFDAILILTIIAFTFLSGAFEAKAESENAKAAEVIEFKRLALGIDISRALHGKRQANPESIGEALAVALSDLTQAARDVSESASRLESVSVGVSALNPHIEALNLSTKSFIENTGVQIAQSVNDLVKSVQSLNTAVGGNVTSLFSEAALSIEEASQQLARTNASVEYGTKQLRDDLDAIHQQLQNVIRGGR